MTAAQTIWNSEHQRYPHPAKKKKKKKYKKKIWATSSGGGYRLEIYFRYSVDKIANRQKIAVNIHYFQYNIFLFYTGA